MKLSDINSDFTKDTEPQDMYLTELLKRAYKGEITCRYAIADISKIQPYSNYQPVVPDNYRTYFTNKTHNGTSPEIFVYAKDDKLIMSDDYTAFEMYKELNLNIVFCIVIGSTPEIVGVEYVGEPFVLPIPTAEVLPQSNGL